MSDKATKQGTQAYANRFGHRAAGGHFRETQGLVLSSLGLTATAVLGLWAWRAPSRRG